MPFFITDHTWAEISLDTLSSNVSNIKKLLSPKTRLTASVKANAYGHGLTHAAKIILESGADCLEVANIHEAIALRDAGITAPIMLLSYTPPENAIIIVNRNIIAAIGDFTTAKSLSNAALRLNKTCRVHIKIDTSGAEYGYTFDKNENWHDAIGAILDLYKMPGLKIEGIFSQLEPVPPPIHSAENGHGTNQKEHYKHQFRRFKSLLKCLESEGISPPICHICGSHGTVLSPEMHLDMIRTGILLYGYIPETIINHQNYLQKPTPTEIGPPDSAPQNWLSHWHSAVKPVMALKTTIASIINNKTAILPIGYADGYPLALSARGMVLINEQLVKIIGKISVNQCMIDTTNVNHITNGDEVTLFGAQQLTAEDVAHHANTVTYDILSGIGGHIRKVLINNGCKSTL